MDELDKLKGEETIEKKESLPNLLWEGKFGLLFLILKFKFFLKRISTLLLCFFTKISVQIERMILIKIIVIN